MSILLKGICWDHTRGHVPLVAAAQRFHEIHPEIEIQWEKRSLRAFGEQSLADLCQSCDLLVVDHPFCGEAAATGCLQAFDSLIDRAKLLTFRKNAVGPSYDSYRISGKQWALPIDVACPVASYRPDLMDRYGFRLPDTWDDLIALAESGCVLFPAIDTDAILHLFALCLARDGELFADRERFASPESLTAALCDLKNLADRCPMQCLDSNPIAILDTLSASDISAYCPFGFGYSNYSRKNYATHGLRAGAPPSYRGHPLRTLLGGAGIALSSSSLNLPTAAGFASFCMASQIQTGLYAYSGGQPGDRGAWQDSELNRHTDRFFANTLTTIESSYLRPRCNGFIRFQHRSGLIVNRYLRGEMSTDEAAGRITSEYRTSNLSPLLE